MIIFRSGPLQVTRIDPSLVGKRTTRTVLVSTILTGAVCNWLATCLIVRRHFSKLIGCEVDRALASAVVLASVAIRAKMIFEDAFMTPEPSQRYTTSLAGMITLSGRSK